MKNLPRRLPEYPFPARINTHADILEQQAHRWLDEYGCLHGMMRLRLKEAGFGYAAARLFPAAGYRQLIPFGRLLMWTAVMDHYAEGSAAAFENLKAQSMDILLHGNLCDPDNEMLRQLAIFREELLNAFPVPACWMERFTASICAYFEGLKLEAPYRAEGRFPDTPEAFIRLREMSSGAMPFIDLIEVETGAVIPEAVFPHHVIQQLRRLTSHLLIWCNDYFSAEKERAQDISNLVLALEHNRQCTPAAAYEAALDIHNATLHEFISVCNNLPRVGAFDPYIGQYVHHLQLMIHGNLSWYMNETTRYQGIN